MGNEVVKPYKIITKREVVSSVVTGSLHDNFLLLENKGSQLYTEIYSVCGAEAACAILIHRGQMLHFVATEF